MKVAGRVEAVQGGAIVGWCMAVGGASTPQFVSVYEDDRLVGTARADIFRADLLHLGGDGRHGFSFALSDRLTDGVVRALSIYAGPGVRELEGSPVRVRLEKSSPAPPPRGAARRFERPRAAVVCWDLSHNPVGRAYVLYKLLEPDWNVELVGPIWRRFGSALWPPLRDEALKVRSFAPANLVDLWREGAKIALAQAYDVVIVCKPRLPGLVIGLQIAEQSRCPIVIDIDENEHVFDSRRSGTDGRQALLDAPFEIVGTDLSHKYLDVADAITLSNPILQELYPGRVVRHARDEKTPRADRARARRRFGFKDSDFVIAFAGTARPHKGMSHVIAALATGADPDVKLLLAGAVRGELHDQIKTAGLTERTVMLDHFAFSELGEILAAADLAPMLQDVDATVARTQMPAKVTDALQHGLRIVATDAPPLRDLAARGGVDVIEGSDFAQYLARLRAEPNWGIDSAGRRRLFEEEFSFGVNRPRLAMAIDEAFAAFQLNGSKVASALRDLLAATQSARADASADRRAPSAGQGAGDDELVIAFFWKQNNSGLFGRRSDMVVKHLLKSGRVRSIVHFDHSVTISNLRYMANARKQGRADVAAMQLDPTIERALGLSDERGLKRRLFVRADESGGARSFGGKAIGGEVRYADFVEESLRSVGAEPSEAIAWVCPIVSGFGRLAKDVGFRSVVADLIDDQRAMAGSDAEKSVIQGQYEATLRAADVVLTNCEGNRRRFEWARADVVVIPNGAESSPASGETEAPQALATLRRPVIGYLGNLRERIDWELLDAISRRKPEWSIVLAGPYEEDRLPAWIKERANLFLPGPVPYESSHAWIRAFDVAIMPHRKSDLTESMNPLKLYNYLAAGAAVVSSPVANIEDVADLVAVEESADGFINAIEDRVSRPWGGIPADRLAAFSWRTRVDAMLREIDNQIRLPRSSPSDEAVSDLSI